MLFTIVGGDVLLFQFNFQVVDRGMRFCHGDLCHDDVPSVSVMKAGLKLKIGEFRVRDGTRNIFCHFQPFRHILLATAAAIRISLPPTFIRPLNCASYITRDIWLRNSHVMIKERKPRKIIILFTSNVQVVLYSQAFSDAKWNRNREFLPTFLVFHLTPLTRHGGSDLSWT